MKKRYRSYGWAFVMRTGALTNVTAPGGIVFSQKVGTLLRKLALFLRYSGKAIRTLACENTGWAGTLTFSAPTAEFHLARRNSGKARQAQYRLRGRR